MINATLDRRVKPRIDCDYQVFVEGRDFEGIRYCDQAKLVNMSAGGLFMYLAREIANGSRISATVYLSKSLIDVDALKLATQGVLVRTEPKINGTYGVAMKFQNYRFF